jgi:hypothetical protein
MAAGGHGFIFFRKADFLVVKHVPKCI